MSVSTLKEVPSVMPMTVAPKDSKATLGLGLLPSSPCRARVIKHMAKNASTVAKAEHVIAPFHFAVHTVSSNALYARTVCDELLLGSAHACVIDMHSFGP